MNSRPVLIVLMLACLAALVRTLPLQSAAAQTVSDSRQQIASVLDKWSVDWKARDAGAISELYAQDAIVYPAIDRRVNPQDTRQLLTAITEKGVEVCMIAPGDFGAITDTEKGKKQRGRS